MPDDLNPKDPSATGDVDEYISTGKDPGDMEAEDDGEGGVYINLPGARAESAPRNEGFYENLAEVLPDNIKDKIVTDLLRKIDEDKEARKKRDEDYAEGIRRTGLGNDAPGGAQFQGASRVVHPMMTEACVDYSSRIMKEICPFAGPVKPKVLGVSTTRKVERANRVAAHMNYQLTNQIKEFRSTLEVVLTQVPLGGSQFVRLWWDHRLSRPRVAFAPIDNIYVPYNAADFASAHRKTYREDITALELKQRVDSGMYVDIGVDDSTSQFPDPSKAKSASLKIEGLEESPTNIDGDREIYETTHSLEIDEDLAEYVDLDEDTIAPFLITIDVTTKKMAGMYRCWEDGDEAREPLDTLYEFPFIPWRGAYSIGFPQIIGGLSAAATGALRALLDSAHISNSPGGFMLKGAGVSGQSRTPEVGTFMEIDGGMETDDIRKRVMPFSLTQPSPVLMQLLGFLVEAARGVVRTSIDEQPADQKTPMPVGTRLSLVEEGLVVYSAIHARAHAAMDRFLAGLYRLNRLYLPNLVKVDVESGEVLVRRADYEGPCAVQPVSEPTIYSNQQRMEQLGFIQQRVIATTIPGQPPLYDARAVELASLKMLKWPDPETLLTPAQKPHELNAVNENLAMALGRQVAAFPEQSHLAHIQVHMDFLKSPTLGSNPVLAPKFMPAAIAHIAEHLVYSYVARTVEAVSQAANRPAHELMSEDPRIKRKFDELLAQASQAIIPEIDQAAQGLMPILTQALQMLKQTSPPPPVDAAQAALQAATAETGRRTQADQMGHQVDTAKVQLQAQALAQKNAVDQDGNQAKRDVAGIGANSRIAVAEIDAESARDIEARKAMSGPNQGPGHFTTGSSLASPHP